MAMRTVPGAAAAGDFPAERVRAAYDLIDTGEARLPDGRRWLWHQQEWLAPDGRPHHGVATLSMAAALLDTLDADTPACGCIAGHAVATVGVENIDRSRTGAYIDEAAIELLGLGGARCVAHELFGGAMSRGELLDMLGRALVDGGWQAAHGQSWCGRGNCFVRAPRDGAAA